MADRLAQSTSPYLLQHADNPVGCRGSMAAAVTSSRSTATDC
ncbi:hypothetical protein ACQSMD_33515 [Streptomyces flavovirens]